jgi:hypothetical protein
MTAASQTRVLFGTWPIEWPGDLTRTGNNPFHLEIRIAGDPATAVRARLAGSPRNGDPLARAPGAVSVRARRGGWYRRIAWCIMPTVKDNPSAPATTLNRSRSGMSQGDEYQGE